MSKRKRPTPAAAARLLADLADVLNACEAAGIPIRLRHGAVCTGHGYVLPLADNQWAARTLTYTEFEPDEGDD